MARPRQGRKGGVRTVLHPAMVPLKFGEYRDEYKKIPRKGVSRKWSLLFTSS